MKIKDYAKSQGVSSQSIYKRIRSPKYRERLKGHLYRDNQKVENLDLIGIKILEDYPFENDVMELERKLTELSVEFEDREEQLIKQFKDREKELLKQLEQAEFENKIINGYLRNSQSNVQTWEEYAESLEQQRIYLIVALAIILLSFLVAMGFAVF